MLVHLQISLRAYARRLEGAGPGTVDELKAGLDNLHELLVNAGIREAGDHPYPDLPDATIVPFRPRQQS